MLRESIRQLISEELDNFRWNIALVEIDQITQAKDFARNVHSGQWRRESPLPYIVHPMRTYHRAKKRGLSKKHQVLAILHDTFEDAKNPQRTLKRIKELFGAVIAKLVVIMSHDKGVDYSIYLAKLAKASKTAFDVKLLDLEDNLIDRPNPKQQLKYKKALDYLEERGIDINPKIKEKLYQRIGK